MADEELGGDLQRTEVWGADMSGSRFRNVDLTGVRFDHVLLRDVHVDGIIERLVVNGVDVTAYVAERDPWSPLRSLTIADAPDAVREAWAALDDAWAAVEARALALPDEARHRRVDDEFSFVETVRHLVMAVDKWFTVPIGGGSFDPIGLPNTGSRDFPFPGVDLTATPTTEAALATWRGRRRQVAEHLVTIGDADLDTEVDVLENGPHPVLHCLQTVFEETFWHVRYADRDLAVLEAEAR